MNLLNKNNFPAPGSKTSGEDVTREKSTALIVRNANFTTCMEGVL
jgi:hypothetical protein